MTQVCTAHLPPSYLSSIRCPSSALFVYLGLEPCVALRSWTTDPTHKSLVFITYYPNLFSRKRSLTCANSLLLGGHYATLQDGRQARFRTVRIVPFARVYCLFGFCVFRPRVGFLSICFVASPAKYIYIFTFAIHALYDIMPPPHGCIGALLCISHKSPAVIFCSNALINILSFIRILVLSSRNSQLTHTSFPQFETPSGNKPPYVAHVHLLPPTINGLKTNTMRV
jgi:hypothetical protein